MLSQVGSFIKEKALIGDTDRVLCLVSGGADSVLMLRMLHSLSQGELDGFPSGFSLGVCHVNYGRRGSASDADEDFVRALGYDLGVTVHSVRAPVQDRPNFQAWARDFRYLAAHNLCRWQGYTSIAVGHNKDDRIETLIYRLITYSGRRSLVVMPPRRGRVIRPLLALSSADIRQYCDANVIGYRHDESNDSLDYSRNRIRHLVMPRLEEIRPDFRDRVLDTLALLEDEDAVLDAVTRDAWRQASEGEDGKTVLIASEVARMPRAAARLLVRRWLTEGASTGIRLSRRLLDSIVDLCQESNGSRSISVSDGLRVARKYDTLSLEPAAGGAKLAPAVPLPVPGSTVFGDYEIEAVEAPAWDEKTGDPLQVVVDAGALDQPLLVRHWQDGDRFTPLGLEGTKTIQDFFTDGKVARDERRRVPLVLSGDRIVWVCGMRISEDFKVTPRSERVVGLKATRRFIDNEV